jgi:carboxypeptidase family protein
MLSHKLLLCSAGLFATLLLCWLTTIAQTSSAQASKAGTISGRVVNESGRPLPNARVSLRQVGSMSLENASTTTDREGRFELSGLKPVSYQIFASLQGYAPKLGGDPVDVQSGVSRVGDFVTLVLIKGGVITGTVTNQAGEPIVGVRVRPVLVHSASRLPLIYELMGAAALTDDRGIYRIYGLPEGTYVVCAGGSAGGRMNPEIDAFDSDVPTYAPASTRDTAQEIIVRPGAEATNVDIQYRGGSGHTISGRASGPEGNQPGQFMINLVSAGGAPWETRSFQGLTDRGFMLQGVDDGDYSITAISARPDGELMLSATKEIKVRGADVSGVELAVQPLSSVTGRVVLEETKTTECSDKQRPVFTETVVSAQSNARAASQTIAWVLPLTSNADERGSFSVKNLLPGRYFFTAQYFADDWYLKSLSVAPSESTKPGKPVDTARTWITLKPGDRLEGLTITLAQGAGSLRGQIVLSEGQTMAEQLYVYLVPAAKEMADDPLRFYGSVVKAAGRVAFNNVAPGRYLIFAQAATDESPLAKLRSPDGTAYRTKLRRDAESVKAEIELNPCQKLADVKVHFKADQGPQ